MINGTKGRQYALVLVILTVLLIIVRAALYAVRQPTAAQSLDSAIVLFTGAALGAFTLNPVVSGAPAPATPAAPSLDTASLAATVLTVLEQVRNGASMFPAAGTAVAGTPAGTIAAVAAAAPPQFPTLGGS